MLNFKTIDILNKFSLLTNNNNPTNDEKLFIWNIELLLAESLIDDFGRKKAKKSQR